jgi:serine/threonine protein kinase
MDETRTRRARFTLLEELFACAQKVPLEERLAVIDDWCRGDVQLRDELIELLRSDAAVQTKIAATDIRERSLWSQNERIISYESWVGREIGPFRIERLLGEGGIGAVFYARRFGGEFMQEVAIKLISRRVYSTAAMQQFYAERDALAKLQHPNIARLLDASFTADGQPYVVMEYVDGRCLHETCDDAAFSPTTKLLWMRQLCDAVDSVHRLLILHRDLKPANVLVTSDGVVKLLDFGTAKLLAPELGDSAMTQAGIRPMTPRYASPEQIEGTPLTTASDLYSLGVVFHRILSGEVPEIDQRGELPPPSIVRARRQKPPFCANRRLTRDLDAISRKAMQLKPEDRYASAGAFAEDIRAAEAELPVTANPDAWSDRGIRFILRHRRTVLSVMLLLFAITAGLLAVNHQSELERESIARNQRALAQEQALAHMLLFDFFEQLKSIPGSTSVQRETVYEATEYLDHIAGAHHSSAGAEIKEDAVDAYTKMGNLLGNPYEENLGDTQGAIATLQKAVLLARELHNQSPDNITRAEALSSAEQSLGRLYFTSGKPQDALASMRIAAEGASQVAAHPQATSAQLAQAASMFDSLGDLYGLPGTPNLNDLTKARAAYEEALKLDRKGFVQDPSCLRCQRGIAIQSWKLGLITEDSDPPFAFASLQQGISIIRAMPAAEQASTKTRRVENVLRNTLGALQLHAGDARGSLATLAPVHERFSRAIALDPIDDRARYDRIALDLDLGEAHGALREWQDAVFFFTEALADATILVERDKTNPAWRTVQARAFIGTGNAQTHLGDSQGKAQLRKGLALAISSAERKGSDADALPFAANSILDHPQLVQDARSLAVHFATQSILVSGKPTREQQETLAKARMMVTKKKSD